MINETLKTMLDNVDNKISEIQPSTLSQCKEIIAESIKEYCNVSFKIEYAYYMGYKQGVRVYFRIKGNNKRYRLPALGYYVYSIFKD